MVSTIQHLLRSTYVERCVSIAFAIAAVLIFLQACTNIKHDNRAGSLGPWAKEYHINTLNISDIKQKVRNGEPFEIRLGDHAVAVVLVPEAIFDEPVPIITVDDEGRIDESLTSEIVTYVGTVLDHAGRNEVRMTIAGELLTGNIIYDGTWWFVEPARKFDVDAKLDEYIIYRVEELEFELDFNDDIITEFVEQVDPDSLPSGSAYLPGAPPTPPSPPWHRVGPSVGILLVADKEYFQQAQHLKVPWYQLQLAVLNDVNGLYRTNLGVWFTPKAFILDKNTLKNRRWRSVTRPAPKCCEKFMGRSQ